MFQFLKLGLLGLVDKVNAVADPFDHFTRPMEIPPGPSPTTDNERLGMLESYFLRDMLQFFTFEDFMLFSHMKPNDLGDMCTWQGVYTAAMVLRSKIEKGSPDAEYVAKRAVDGLLLFSEYRLLRGVRPVNWVNPQPDRPIFVVDPTKQNEYFSGEDGRYRRDNASFDSLCGWLYGVCHAFAAGALSPAQRNAVGGYCIKFAMDGARLRNRDGAPTALGDCRPGFLQAPARTLAAVAMLRLAELLSGENFGWSDMAKRYGKEFEYLDTQIPGRIDWENINLAVMVATAYALITPPALNGADSVRWGLLRLLRKYRKTGNAFLVGNIEYLGFPIVDDAVRDAQKILCEFSMSPEAPNGKAPAVVKNSPQYVDAFKFNGELCARQPVPVWKRVPNDFHWQRNPYQLDGGTESSYNGFDFLMAHYLLNAEPVRD